MNESGNGRTLCAIKDKPYYCPGCGNWYGAYVVADGRWTSWCWNCDPRGWAVRP